MPSAKVGNRKRKRSPSPTIDKSTTTNNSSTKHQQILVSRPRKRTKCNTPTITTAEEQIDELVENEDFVNVKNEKKLPDERLARLEKRKKYIVKGIFYFLLFLLHYYRIII